MSSHGSNSNSNNNTAIQSQASTPVQLQYQTTYSPQIIAVNPNSIVNNYPPSISTPTSPIVQSVYSQQSTPIQSPVNIQNSTSDANSSASNNNVSNVSSANVTTASSAPPKRKRSVNPQGEENFLRALDAVRFGGIGFCKLSILGMNFFIFSLFWRLFFNKNLFYYFSHKNFYTSDCFMIILILF